MLVQAESRNLILEFVHSFKIFSKPFDQKVTTLIAVFSCQLARVYAAC